MGDQVGPNAGDGTQCVAWHTGGCGSLQTQCLGMDPVMLKTGRSWGQLLWDFVHSHMGKGKHQQERRITVDMEAGRLIVGM